MEGRGEANSSGRWLKLFSDAFIMPASGSWLSTAENSVDGPRVGVTIGVLPTAARQLQTRMRRKRARVNQDLPRDANPQSCTNYSSAAISRRAKIFRINCSWYGSPTVLTHPPSFPGQPCNRENQKCLPCRRTSKECLPCSSRVLTRSKGFQRSQTQDHWGLHRNQWAQL